MPDDEEMVFGSEQSSKQISERRQIKKITKYSRVRRSCSRGNFVRIFGICRRLTWSMKRSWRRQAGEVMKTGEHLWWVRERCSYYYYNPYGKSIINSNVLSTLPMALSLELLIGLSVDRTHDLKYRQQISMNEFRGDSHTAGGCMVEARRLWLP